MREEEKILCPWCSGDGYTLARPFEKCRCCEGTGKTTEAQYEKVRKEELKLALCGRKLS